MVTIIPTHFYPSNSLYIFIHINNPAISASRPNHRSYRKFHFKNKKQSYVSKKKYFIHTTIKTVISYTEIKLSFIQRDHSFKTSANFHDF